MTVKSFFLIQLIIIINSIYCGRRESWQVTARLRGCCWGASVVTVPVKLLIKTKNSLLRFVRQTIARLRLPDERDSRSYFAT